MSDTVILVENLSKKYLLSHLADKREQLFSRLLVNKARTLLSRGKKVLSSPFTIRHSPFTDSTEEFWALKDVSFEIKQGDRVGIIGRNGAGKSTLLKILSRITEPTKGRITIDGRVASLLEVGTGFHSELSGRENIYLNGAILGMSREEIKSKFDEIVAFAEVERFLDTPVKRYSSGMYVRLAFAVAAHLEPEILIVDEVLAVGDAQFQKKCLGKMEDVSTKEGRTVLFVSHNMDAISTLCTKGIMLGAGEIVKHGNVTEVIKHYNEALTSDLLSVEKAGHGGIGGIYVRNVWLEDSSRKKTELITAIEPISLNIEADVDPIYQNGNKISVGFGIDTIEGHRLFTTVSSWVNSEIITKGEKLRVRCFLPSIPLVPGRYLISVIIFHQMDALDCVISCASFEITENASFYVQRTRDHGHVNIPCQFEVEDV